MRINSAPFLRIWETVKIVYSLSREQLHRSQLHSGVAPYLIYTATGRWKTSMDLASNFQLLGIALGLGLLVGLERDRAASRLAGMRTFPLVTLFGALCSVLSQSFGGWILAAGFVSLVALVVLGKLREMREGAADPGLTTEVALLLMFGVGAYLMVGIKEMAIAIGGGLAVLLQFKGSLHGIARKLGDDDLK